jgi:hypothetical protein
MKRLAIAAAAVCAALLSGCATYDYGYPGPYYGYSGPYYGYAEPYVYGYTEPYTYRYYDYGPYGYSPYYGWGSGYYAGPPVVGFDFRYRNSDQHAHRDHTHAGKWSGERRQSGYTAGDRASQHPRTTRAEPATQRNDANMTRSRGPRVSPPAPPRRDAGEGAQASRRTPPGTIARSDQ